MLYTIPWVIENYNKYNDECFGGQLPAISAQNIHLTKKRTPWGRGGCDRFVKDWYGNYSAQGVYLELSNYYDVPEHDKLEVLIHEMCHIYEFFCEPRYIIQVYMTRRYSENYPRNGHGKIFYEQANRLTAFGFHVQRFVDKDTINASEISDEIKAKKQNSLDKGYHFLAFTYKSPVVAMDGRRYPQGYVVCYGNYDKWLSYIAMNSDNWESVKDYVTHDPNVLKMTINKSVGRIFLVNNVADKMNGIEFDSETGTELIGQGEQTNATDAVIVFKMALPPSYGYPYAHVSVWKKDQKKWTEYLENSHMYETVVVGTPDNIKDIKYIPNRVGKGVYGAFSLDKLPKTHNNNVVKVNTFRERSLIAASELMGNNEPEEQETKYTFELKLLKNGTPYTLKLENKTEEEIKNYMKQQFPNWTPDKIDEIFTKFAREQVQSLSESVNNDMALEDSEDEKLDAQIRRWSKNAPDELQGFAVDN